MDQNNEMEGNQNADLGFLISTMGICSRLPFFSGNTGESVNDFVTSFEYCSQVGNWPTDKSVLLAKSSLKGDAKLFVECHPVLSLTLNWAEFKRLLVERFSPKRDNYTIERQFSTCIQHRGETVETYACRLRALARYLHKSSENVHEQRAIDRIIDDRLIKQFSVGVLPNLQRDLLLNRPSTFAEAIEIAKNVESVEESIRVNPNSVNSLSTVDIMKQIELAVNKAMKDVRPEKVENESRDKQYNQNFRSNSFNRNRNSNNNFRQNSNSNRCGNNRQNFNRQQINMQDVICFKCGKEGHFAKNCGDAQQAPTVVCGRCKKDGHRTVFCRVKPEDIQPISNHHLNENQS